MNIPTGNVSLTGRPTPYDTKFIFNMSAFLADNTGANILDYCTSEQFNIADVDGNHRILSVDATFFALYLAYVYNRGTMTIQEWVAAGKPGHDT
jgi:hypothetical protein